MTVQMYPTCIQLLLWMCVYVSDEVVGQVLSIMKTQAVPYTAVYTALRASRVSLPRLMSLIYGQHQLTHQFCHCDSG